MEIGIRQTIGTIQADQLFVGYQVRPACLAKLGEQEGNKIVQVSALQFHKMRLRTDLHFSINPASFKRSTTKSISTVSWLLFK